MGHSNISKEENKFIKKCKLWILKKLTRYLEIRLMNKLLKRAMMSKSTIKTLFYKIKKLFRNKEIFMATYILIQFKKNLEIKI